MPCSAKIRASSAGVVDVAFVERHALGHGEAEAGGQVVDHRDRPAGVAQREHRVAADIAGAAGDEDGTLAVMDGTASRLRRRG